ncbi:MAG: ethanolamine ammonia-lyase reactivating factor EutA [Deltaproteobacteria bacterium]|nr:ethanolamine ammonia-lyase reactivating factor EutA [Deltaproteobacteria bacterium]
MTETIISVGIDLGTTTTQVIFSRLTVENIAGAASVPRIQIVDKKIIHQGQIRFTPLLDRTIIDAEGVLAIVQKEYEAAGFKPSDVSAGAVIITGDTAKKENSEKVLSTLSGLAGDFVVATAGSDLESVLAGRGAGTAEMSRQEPGRPLANLDIGGGTTNIGIFLDGQPVDTSCLDIGGRQIMVDPIKKTITQISPKVITLAASMGLKIKEGDIFDIIILEKICDRLVSIMAQAIGLVAQGRDDRDGRDGNDSRNDKSHLELFLTSHPLKKIWRLYGLTFSGGVADFIYGDLDTLDPFRYGDIGPILGKSVLKSSDFNSLKILKPKETIRATVVGAGSNALELSGSTVTISHPEVLPLKNLPIVKLTADDEADNYRYFSSRLASKLSWYREASGLGYQPLAVAFAGLKNPSYEQVLLIRDRLLEGLDFYLSKNDLLVVILEEDMAKSLGQTLRAALPQKVVISLDSVKVESGDYIDIGLPVVSGRVVPVIVKTLVFGR